MRARGRSALLHSDLEAVEEAGLRDLHLLGEALDQVLVDDAVRRGKERQHVRDEVALIVVQLGPVAHVVREVDLLGGPEAGLGLLVLWGSETGRGVSRVRARTVGGGRRAAGSGVLHC